MTPPDALRARVLAAAAATPSATRSQGKRAALVLTLLSVVVAAVVIELAGGVAHAAGRPLGVTAAVVGGWSAVAATLSWLAFARGRSTLARRPLPLVAAALASPVVLFAWMVAFFGTYQEPFQRVGYRCIAYTLLCALVPLASFLWLRRGVEPRRPAALGAAAGAACGAWACVVVHLWCPLSEPSHVVVGHALPLSVVILAGAALGDRLLGVARRRVAALASDAGRQADEQR